MILGGPLAFAWLFTGDTWAAVFYTIFILRYARLFGHCCSWFTYREVKVQADQDFSRHDVTVIVPTVDPADPDFKECLSSILQNAPAAILVVTVGPHLRADCQRVIRSLSPLGSTRVGTSSVQQASKRLQVAHALDAVNTQITVLADDHVFWSNDTFLPSVVAAFNNQKVGIVATKKLVRRTMPGKWNWASLVNFVACLYLQRHNWELRTSCGMDNCAFVVSGRTAAYRTEFLKDPALIDRYCNERFMFGTFGGEGLGPDDDNFLTREAMKQGWLIHFQDTEEAIVETSLGTWPKFRGQVLRWARTTFRSNPVMLRDPRFLYRYTWSAFMVYCAGITNFAIAWDTMLFVALIKAGMTSTGEITALVMILLMGKTVKVLPHFFRHPEDIPLIPVQIAFGYIHSFFKLWALITFWDCGWSGRDLEKVNTNSGAAGSKGFDYIA